MLFWINADNADSLSSSAVANATEIALVITTSSEITVNRRPTEGLQYTKHKIQGLHWT